MIRKVKIVRAIDRDGFPFHPGYFIDDGPATDGCILAGLAEDAMFEDEAMMEDGWIVQPYTGAVLKMENPPILWTGWQSRGIAVCVKREDAETIDRWENAEPSPERFDEEWEYWWECHTCKRITGIRSFDEGLVCRHCGASFEPLEPLQAADISGE